MYSGINFEQPHLIPSEDLANLQHRHKAHTFPVGREGAPYKSSFIQKNVPPPSRGGGGGLSGCADLSDLLYNPMTVGFLVILITRFIPPPPPTHMHCK